MAALANGTVLVLVSVFIFFKAYQRLLEPAEVKTPLMLAVAVVGLVANVGGLTLLSRASRRSLNVKAAFWHIVGDTVSSVGVIVAGVVILVTGWYPADTIVAVFIGVIVLWGAVGLVRESVDILMEAVPRHIRIEEVIDTIKRTTGVADVHDVHIWTITSGIYALSAHLVISDQMVSKSTEVVSMVNRNLASHSNIRHTTLQLECDTCPSGIVCEIGQRHPDDSGHGPSEEKHQA